MRAGVPSGASALNPIRKHGTRVTGSQSNSFTFCVNLKLEAGGFCADAKLTISAAHAMPLKIRAVIATVIEQNCPHFRSELTSRSDFLYLDPARGLETNLSAVRPIRMSSASRNS